MGKKKIYQAEKTLQKLRRYDLRDGLRAAQQGDQQEDMISLHHQEKETR